MRKSAVGILNEILFQKHKVSENTTTVNYSKRRRLRKICRQTIFHYRLPTVTSNVNHGGCDFWHYIFVRYLFNPRYERYFPWPGIDVVLSRACATLWRHTLLPRLHDATSSWSAKINLRILLWIKDLKAIPLSNTRFVKILLKSKRDKKNLT